MRSGWMFCLLLVPCLSLAAGLPPQLATTPAPKSGGFHGNGVADTREGGESWNDAVVITALPFNDSGATCDNADDITLPCASSHAPDVVYQYTPLLDQRIDVNLCGSGYDTALGIYDSSHANLACNDDYCAQQSAIVDFALQAGQAYYFVVDGYGTSCGSYQISVTIHTPCTVECPPGAQIEGEPPCVDGYIDQYNSGCGGTGWTLIQPQDGDCGTMCGRSCTYLYNGFSYRDTDWYTVLAAGGPMTVTGTAEFPLRLIFIYGTNCGGLQYILDTGAPCESVTLSWPSAQANQEYWIYVDPSVFSGVPESDYTLQVCGIALDVQGACCFYWGCNVVTETFCDGNHGIWQGPGTTCDPDPCTPVVGACCWDTYECDMMTFRECIGLPYSRFLPNIPCDPPPCGDNPGACCLQNGECEVLLPTSCGILEGSWAGPGVACEPNLCQEGPAACCFNFGICRLYYRPFCEEWAGGTPLGPGTDCDPNPCVSDPLGACCFANGSCDMRTASECAQAQGVWQGAGLDCDPNPCPATPVVRTTWGRIKNSYR
jgi:hypothetical protein